MFSVEAVLVKVGVIDNKMDQAPALHFRCMVFLLLKKRAKLNLLVVGCLCQEFMALISRDESSIHSGTSDTARTRFLNRCSIPVIPHGVPPNFEKLIRHGVWERALTRCSMKA